MAIKAKFFNGVEYDATDVNEQFQYFYTNGIVSNTGSIGNSFAVSRKAGLILAVASGIYCINGGVCEIDGDGAEITLDAADESLSRIDTIAIEYNLSADVHTIRVVAVKGTPANEPESPELQNTSTIYQEPLADVLISAGATEAGTITDRRQLVAYQRLSSAEFISHKNNRSNPHGVTAAQAGAIPGVECEKYMDRIHETPNLIDNPLLISQSAGAAADVNRTFRFSYGSGTERSANYPTELQTGTIMGIREVQWSNASQVVVKLTEWYPVLGRTWYNRWTGTAWTGWESQMIQMPSQAMRYDMGGCADTNSVFRAYGPVTVTKYDTWARIDFAISPGNISWTGIDASDYFAYGIPLATLRSITGLPLNYAQDVIIPGQAFFKANDATANGGICGGFQVKGAYLCPGRWYFDSGTSTYKFGPWTANGPCNVNGAIWSGTINVGT